ncbi:hypothetical protein EJ06DRAFT_526229 [Trichodelitschia bisporula]|uniref:Uncharacterized protein n=1 Tax=Trichodelitschia bisporula TaxID=703511 RepID=A0A6G1I813_9PEZI|nr:hypothetical protein EJ06DRAFT_526229 [Trichodelitschia bisporula]
MGSSSAALAEDSKRMKAETEVKPETFGTRTVSRPIQSAGGTIEQSFKTTLSSASEPLRPSKKLPDWTGLGWLRQVIRDCLKEDVHLSPVKSETSYRINPELNEALLAAAAESSTIARSVETTTSSTQEPTIPPMKRLPDWGGLGWPRLIVRQFVNKEVRLSPAKSDNSHGTSSKLNEALFGAAGECERSFKTTTTAIKEPIRSKKALLNWTELG